MKIVLDFFCTHSDSKNLNQNEIISFQGLETNQSSYTEKTILYSFLKN